MKLLLIDTETGGLNPESHSILSLAALVIEDGKVLDEMYTLINEGERIIAEESALRINGLTMARVIEQGVSPSVAVDLLLAMLERHGMHEEVTICAHNAPFDTGFLKRLFRLAGRDYAHRFSYRNLCTHSAALFMQYAGRITLPNGSASLDSLVKYMGIPLDREGGHNALKDARATAIVLDNLVYLTRHTPFSTLGPRNYA